MNNLAKIDVLKPGLATFPWVPMVVPPKLITDDEPLEPVEEDNAEFFEHAFSKSRSVSRASHTGTMHLKIPTRSAKIIDHTHTL